MSIYSDFQTEELLSIEGVRGFHFMTVGWTKAIPKVVKKLGLFPRPVLGEEVRRR